MSYSFGSLFGKKSNSITIDEHFQQKQTLNKQHELNSSEPHVTNNNLQEKMMLTIDSESDGTVFSSFSLISALSMLLIGLTNETLNEITSNLSISDKNELFTKIENGNYIDYHSFMIFAVDVPKTILDGMNDPTQNGVVKFARNNILPKFPKMQELEGWKEN